MDTLIGVFLGLAFAVGVLLVAKFVRTRRVTLDDRLAPYLVASDARERLLGTNRAHTPLEILGRLVAPWFSSLSAGLGRLGSTNAQVARKLQLAGRPQEVELFRLEQIAWAGAGLAVGLVTSAALLVSGRSSVFTLLALIALCTVLGPIFGEYLLTRTIANRTQRLLMEFPTIAELLALAVSAGESPLAALERVAATSSGELTHELRYTLAQTRSGIPLQDALQQLGKRTEVPTVTRFADAIAIAMERGTPLSGVLQAQAQDARDSGHRELMKIGGSKELRMLFPVVFLILPITVLFAAFPSIVAFDIGF